MKKKILNGLGMAAALWLLTSCGSNSSTGIPTPIDPNAASAPLDPRSRGTDPRIPDLTKTAAVLLTDNTTYLGLKDLFGAIFAPVVGDPKLLLQYKILNRTTGKIAGSLKLAVEDSKGLAVINMNHVNYGDYGIVSFTDGTYVNIIYSDNAATVFIAAAYDQGTTLYGDVYYRRRASGESQCLPYTITCGSSTGGSCSVPANVQNYYDQQAGTNCWNYMMPGTNGTTVKDLGSFTVPTANFEI